MEGKKLLALFSKNYRKDNGDWNTVALTLEEEQEVREAHRQDLIDIFRECHEDAQELTSDGVNIIPGLCSGAVKIMIDLLLTI